MRHFTETHARNSSFANVAAGRVTGRNKRKFPTHLRGAGTGAAAAFGRVASIISPLLVPLLLTHVGTLGLFGIFATAFFIAAGAAWLLPEQKGTALH